MKKIVMIVLLTFLVGTVSPAWAWDGPDMPGKYTFRTEEEKDSIDTTLKWTFLGITMWRGLNVLGKWIDSQKLELERLKLEQTHELTKMQLEYALWEKRQLFLEKHGIKGGAGAYEDPQRGIPQFAPAIYQTDTDTGYRLVPVNY